MTLLEMMVVMVIIGAMAYFGYGVVRRLTRADLVEDSTRMAQLMAFASERAAETGQLHRVTIDLDEGVAYVEVCQGAGALHRYKHGEQQLDAKQAAREIEDAKGRMQAGKGGGMARAIKASSPEEETKIASALAGHHVGDQACTRVTEGLIDEDNPIPVLKLDKDRGIKARQVWVQHRDDSVTTGQVSIYFFPLGSAEKAIVELTDGSDTYSVRVHGLTGQIETVDGEIREAAGFIHKDVTGEKEAER
jgi:prepilin-type N-terminal cleavage/methylation domain-containing protein